MLNFHRSVDIVSKRCYLYRFPIKANKISRCDQTELHKVFVAKIIKGAGKQMEVTLNSTKSTKSTDKKYFFCNGSLKLSEKEKAVCLIRQKSHTSCFMNAVQTPVP